MEIKYTLKYSIGKAEELNLVKVDNTLTLVLESDYVLDDLLTTITDGNISKKVRTKRTNRVEIPSEFVKAGTLCFDIAMIKGGKAIKTFACEPLTIVEEGCDVYAYNAFREVNNTLRFLIGKNKSLETTIAGLEERIANAEKSINEYWQNEEK